ncbi:DapH/DapD/GlmU-related protein [Alistipes indistinctus]|uniref:DapH/DapD/GlmU-related protein n=1 Tax=Alistipes indistinctus TaxID=626932 RepID=UPI001F5523B1|nr:DapH/DapD/GlmU-related protein [Alistipes indistinctus]
MLFWLLRTKIVWRRARLIRFPLDLRGKRYIDPGAGLTTGVGCRLEAYSDGPCVLRFGQNVQLNDYVHICAMREIEIGNHVLMASKIYISDNSHGRYDASKGNSDPETLPLERSYQIEPVFIGDKTWIGDNACILPGTRLGRGSVVGANSVVRGVFPDYCVIVGAPARIVKRYDPVRKGWYRTDPRGEFVL